MYVEKIQTWKDNWNDIIRYLIFQDEQLRQLMCLPKDINIMKFVDKYFIQLQAGSEVLSDEAVRILYYDTKGGSTRNKNVFNKNKQFDIYVKQDQLHTATKDRLQNRYDLIVERLKYLLLNHGQQYGLRFRFNDSYNLWTKTQGYRRYHVVFSYKTTV